MNETEELMALVPEGMFANASELQSFIDQQGMQGVYDLIPSGMFTDVTELEEAFGSKKKEPLPLDVMPSPSPEEVEADEQVDGVPELDTELKPVSTRVDIKGPGEKIEEPEPEQDRFFEMSMAAVTPDLIDAPDDRDTAKELNYQFGRYGFDFTTSPYDLHDKVYVKSADGAEIEINLDPMLDIGRDEETEKLRSFLRRHKMQSEVLTRAEKGYKEARLQFGTREQIDQEVARVNAAENDYRKLFDSYVAREDAIEQKHAGLLKYTQEYLDANPDEFEAYKAAFKMYQDDMATLEEDRIKLLGMHGDLVYQAEQLNRAQAEFVKLKAEQYTTLGLAREALSRGTALMFGEPVSDFIDIVSQVMPLGSGRGYEQDFIETAQGMGLVGIPEAITTEAPEGSRPGDEAYTQWLRAYRKEYDDWYENLPEQLVDEVRDKMRDKLAKGLKYNPEMGGMVDSAYEGVYRTLGDRKFNEDAYAKAKEDFLSRALLSLLESAPAFISSGGKRGGVKAVSSLVRLKAQAEGALDREFRADPELSKISELEKGAVKEVYGLTIGALERFGFRNAIGRKGIVNGIIMRVLNKAPVGVKAKTLRELVQQEVKSAAARGIISTGASTLAEMATEFEQGYAEVGIKQVYNAMKGKEMFEGADVLSKETFFQALEQGAMGAVGGAILSVPGSIADASTTYDFTKLDDATMATFEFLANPGNRGASKQMFVTDLKNKVNRGELTGQQAKEAEANYEKVVQAYDGMREVEGMTMEEKKQVLGLEVRRQELLRRKEATAAPFQGRIDREISDLNLKIQDALQEREAAPVDVGERARAGERVDEEVREEEAVVTPEAEEEVIPEAAAATNQDRRAYDDGTLEAPRLEQLLSGVADKLRAKGRMTAFQSRLLTENRERVDTLVELKDRSEAEALREEAALDETIETLAPNVESRRVTTVDLNRIQERVVSRAQAAAKAISKVAPNVKFVLHETTAQYNRATGFTGAGVFKDGTVHINLERADNRTVAHETLHAIMLSADGMTLPVVQQVTKRMATSLSKSLDKGSELKKRLDKFIARYDENVRDEEKVAELFGYMADGYANLEAPQKSLIRRYVEKIAETFGVNLPSGWGQQDQDVIDFLNTVSRKVAAGEVITEEEVAVTRATREEQRAETDENLRAAEQKVSDFSMQEIAGMSENGVVGHFTNEAFDKFLPKFMKTGVYGAGFYFTGSTIIGKQYGKGPNATIAFVDTNDMNLVDRDRVATPDELRTAANWLVNNDKVLITGAMEEGINPLDAAMMNLTSTPYDTISERRAKMRDTPTLGELHTNLQANFDEFLIEDDMGVITPVFMEVYPEYQGIVNRETDSGTIVDMVIWDFDAINNNIVKPTRQFAEAAAKGKVSVADFTEIVYEPTVTPEERMAEMEEELIRTKPEAEAALRAAEQRVADFSDEQLQAMADEGVIFHFGPVDITRVIPEKLKRFGLGYGFYFTDYALEDSVFRGLGERVTMADSNELNLLDGDTAITEEQAKALRSAAKTELQEAEEYGDDLGFEESQVLMSIAETRAGEQWYAYFTSSLDDNRKVESELTDEQKATAARLVQEMLGFDGVTYGSDQRNTGVITSAWNFNKLNRAIIPPTRAAEQRIDIDAVRTRSRAGNRVSKGLATYSVKGEQQVEEIENLTRDYVREQAPKAYIKNANVIAKYPLVRGVKEFGDITTVEQADELYDIYTQQTMDNLRWMMETYPDEFSEISTLWYDGANKIANELATEFDVTPEQAAGILAALSPQKDWYQNAHLARLLLEAFADNPVMTRKMVNYQREFTKGKIAEKKKALKKARAAKGKSRAKAKVDKFNKDKARLLNDIAVAEALLESIAALEGTRMLDADPSMIGYYVRLHSETTKQPSYPVISPDGEMAGPALKDDGETAKWAWGSYNEIGKGVSINLNGSPENITLSLGQQHKVRNFFNNIIDPMSAEGDVTMDTHAIAVSLLKPLSTKSAEVEHNFGSKGVSNSGAKGIKGTYYANQEAYQMLAEEMGLLPRQVQSVTWEAVRGLFTDKFKANKENVKAINQIWENYADGKITIDEARAQVLERAGGVNPPVWAESVQGELGRGVREGRERGAGRTGGRAAEQRVADVVERYKFRPEGSLIGDSRLAAELGRNLERYGFGVEQFGDRMNRFFIVDADGRRVDPKKLVAEDRADELEEMEMRAEERAAQEARELAEREQELFETEEAPFLETIFPESDLPAREQKDDLDKSGPTELDRLVAYAKERGYSNAAILLARPEAQPAIDAYEEAEKRMLKELNGVIKKTRARVDATEKRVLESALGYLQGSKFYADATDVGRELMVRGLREKLGVREKRAPSAKRIVSGPVERVTLTVREALNNQLKSEARGARAAAAASKAVLKQMAADITELQREGKITAKQAATVIRRFASVNVFNPVAVDNFLDYMAKVFADAEYASDMARLRKMRPTAKKNVKRKLGRQPELISDILTVLAIDPTRIPVDTLPQYRNLLDIMSKRRAVLELPDIIDLVSDVKSILDAVNEEQSLADELADIFEAFDAKVPTKAGGINFNETLKAMVAAEVITDADATLMRKYKSDIVDTSRAEKTEEQLEVEAKEMRSIIRGSELSINRLGTRLDRDAARKFEKLLKTEAVNELNNRQLENLLRVIDNINNGYLTHSAQLAIERMEAKNRARSLNEALEGAKLNTIRQIGGALTNVKDARLGAIVRNPLELIDQVFGNFKTTPIYDATFRPIAEAAAAMMTEKGKIDERLTKAQIAVAKSHKRSPNAIVRSKYLMTTYLLQLEHESNPGNKQTPSAMAFLDATIKAAEDGTTTKYNKADIGILKGIRDKYTKGKEIDAEAIYSDFNAAERNALKTVQEINIELTPKAEFASSVVRGAAIEPILNYLHHSVLPDESLRTDKTDALRVSEAYNQRMRPSTRAKTFVDRTPGAKPIEFDIMATVNRGANQTLTDFYLTEPIRTARKALNETETENKEVLRSITNAVDGAVRNALERSVTTSNLAEKALDLVAKQGYRTMLASIPRFASELISNLSYVALADPAAFEQGIKYRDYFGVDGADIMTNVGSAQTKRVYPSERLSGRMVDTSVMSGHMGSTGSRAGRESLNSLGQMLNYAQEYPNAVALVADGLISTPDKLIMRPLWFGAFAKAFKAETGRDVDYDAIARNDEAYMTEFAEAIEAAKREADRVSAQAGATDNPFMGIQKGKSKGEMKPLMQTLRIANNFMSRFIIYEFTAARTGIQAAVGNGTITQEQGVRLFAAVLARMTLYSLLTPILSDMFTSLFTDVPEEDEEPDQLFTRALLSGLTTMAGGVMGQLGRIPVNYGVEYVNENYLDFLRDGEYDPYDDYLQFNNVPDFKRGTDFADFMFPLMGAGAPMARTTELGFKTIGREGKKRATRERYAREQTQRLPLEVLGNLGLIPFYRDVRKVLITDMYGDMDKKKKGGIMAN